MLQYLSLMGRVRPSMDCSLAVPILTPDFPADDEEGYFICS
jgi:hypothetical protein